jgi:signal transduction histidine kinase
MGLRVKLALAFVAVLMTAILAVSALEINRVTRVMVDELGDSGQMLIDQTFEQLMPILAQARPDASAAALNDPRLHAFLGSAQAFGRGVVFVRIEDRKRKILAAVPPSLEGRTAPEVPDFAVLLRKMGSRSPFIRAHAVWKNRTYVIRRAVELNGNPVAIIQVGLSTGLISDEMRGSVAEIGLIGVVATVVCFAIVAVLLAGALVRPLRALARGVDLLAAGRTGVAFSLASPDELGTLADKFNHLSERIRADRTQWENERGQFFNIFRSITDALILLDGRGTVLFANREAQNRIELPPNGGADGQPLSQLLGHDHPLTHMIEASYSGGSEVHDAALELGRNGASERFLTSIFSIGHGPEPPGLLIIMRDLKPVQELETVVDYSGRLARLGGLISGVAHQIRNPLNAMSLQLELLNQDSELARPVEPRVQAVRREIRRLDQAVDALLRFMRPEQLKYGAVALNDLLAEIGNQVVRAGVKLEYHLDPNLPSISADRALLGEALRNIAINAVEAMPQGGTLTFYSAVGDAGVVEVSIGDEGPGIPSEHLDRIFQLYFTTKEGGSGLGLPVALRAIDLHGGAVDVNSRAGAGTVVMVRLPIAAEPRPPLAVGTHLGHD